MTLEHDDESLWEFADIGFDTNRKLWFLQLTDKTNQIVNTRHARKILLSRGEASQYQWKDIDGRPFWHVRERFFSRDVESISETPDGTIKIQFQSASDKSGATPSDFAYLLYAYHLNDKEGHTSVAPMGFVEFFGKKGELIKKIDKKWIIVEGASRRTSGEYPHIRMRVDRDDISEVLVTASCIVLKGNHNHMYDPSSNTKRA